MKTKKKTLLLVTVSLIAAGLAASLPALAESAPLTYTASPDVYKLIAENDEFRVILATWKPGQSDALHSHGGPYALYRLTDCKLQLTTPDGHSDARDGKAGTVSFSPAVAAHSAKNVGSSDCQILTVERK
jgi:hypothetical protein